MPERLSLFRRAVYSGEPWPGCEDDCERVRSSPPRCPPSIVACARVVPPMADPVRSGPWL